ncbi:MULTISPECIES: ATP-grasp domain-containing protein [unclassified Streptomyces]|uniref:ATP-grasp domain-containing protein n=1 Tax=unclassified Streptomyces TaxID=2593676 RepID=UPI001161E3CE|nr:MULTISPECIES: ATP-grasp domain-containing protein [unclassified Streptomyces]NMI55849.1 ATP-grasp domain-containing protein [Streptomyces sp. RLA2-12]QDN55322.1 ATP-grasp domain-containing protein [Streptomyces sp. S1D4-20]QDN65501.1 ATP-grasp domain-containing protein [Streptomyces sp. S1D4-14]QDN96141.1 ATP-grasp domain-containing protein [Streptomyces sp. RLB1-9]QDO17847.1 ATP-grasp domain-containing protein [Streptomyces sp. S1A1-8]
MSVPVLLLEAAGPESEALARTAAAAGHPVHAVTDAATLASYSGELRQLLEGCLVTGFTRPGQAVADITGYGRRIGVKALLTVNEYLTEVAARSCAALGLPGNDPERAAAARNKALMATAFEAGHVTMPRTKVVADLRELRVLHEAGAVGFPCVVKPADGAGSAGVTVVTGPEELEPAWHAARTARVMYGMLRDERILVQEQVQGREFSVESITQHDVTTHLCITRKHTTSGIHRVELGHTLPARLPAAAERALLEQAGRAIAAVGVRNGATHTELVLSPDGRCTVLEIGARLGAGHIGVLMQHALGIDPWRTVWDIALGRPVTITQAPGGYATVRFLTTHHAGRLVAVTGLPAVTTTIPAVRVRAAEGSDVGPATSNRGRLGHVIVTGHDPRTVDERADQILRQITITVAPGSRT